MGHCYLPYKFDWREMICDQARMNLASHRVWRLSGNYFEPCSHIEDYCALTQTMCNLLINFSHHLYRGSPSMQLWIMPHLPTYISGYMYIISFLDVHSTSPLRRNQNVTDVQTHFKDFHILCFFF